VGVMSGISILDRAFSEAANCVVGCDDISALVGAIENLTLEEMQSALLDMGVFLSAQRIRAEIDAGLRPEDG